jgi:hypothetical protein
MKIKFIALIGVVVIPLLAGCALKPVTLDPVGSAPGKTTAYVPTGWLRVYTATDAHEIGNNTYLPGRHPYPVGWKSLMTK